MFELGGLTLLILIIGIITERVTPIIAIGVMCGILIIEIVKWYIPKNE